MTDMFSLAGKTALVTGASRGIGFGMARGLAEAGAEVYINGRDPAVVDRSVAALRDAGLKAAPAPFDATDEAAGRAAIETIAGDRGHFDILIANAGMTLRQPVTDFATDDWKRIVDLNLTASFTIARDAARVMTAQGRGRIIFTCSVMSFLGRPTVPAYTATKHGVAGLVKAMGAELGRTGITVNGIGPGYFKTDLTAPLVADPEFSAWVAERTPVGRWAEPQELAGAAVFLASDAASYVNGHVLMVDGGMTTAV